MPVQAQPPSSLGEHRSRARAHFQTPGVLISAASIHPTAMDDSQQQQVLLGAPISSSNMHRFIPYGASPMLPGQGIVLQNLTHAYRHGPAIAAAAAGAVEGANPPILPNLISGTRKRSKESIDMQHRASHVRSQQVQSQHLGVDLNQTLVTSFPNQVGSLLSTGLLLAFEDERSTVTSSRPSTTSACGPWVTLGEKIAAQVSSHQEDIDQLLKSQAEQLRQALEERMRVQAKSLMVSVEGEAVRKLRKKDAEMERVSRRNAELEERVRQLSMEREAWQSKAKSNEAMVVSLRSNLQQAMAQVQHQSREASRIEGCGDSEADDAGSVYIDDNLPAKQSRAMMMRNAMTKSSLLSGSSELIGAAPAVAGMARLCRQCGAHEASVLLVPCLHLCICVQCNQSSSAGGRCPVCSMAVSNTAEVFLA